MQGTAQFGIEAHVGLCHLLARIWGREIDAEMLAALRGERFQDLMPGLAETDNTILLDNLAAEYCRIMLGPRGHAAPIQSVWAEGRLNGQATLQMRRVFEVVRIGELLVPETPDHFANQLQVFGTILADRCLDEQERTELAKHFYGRHLDWAGPMLRKAGSIASNGFYRHAIVMTRWWLAESNPLLSNENSP